VDKIECLVARLPSGAERAVIEREARIAPDCTACHHPSMHVVAPDAGPIRSINARVPLEGARETCMQPGLEHLGLWNFPIELLLRVIHHKLSCAQGPSADENIKTTLLLKNRGMHISFDAEGNTWKVQVTTMPHGDKGGRGGGQGDALDCGCTDERE